MRNVNVVAILAAVVHTHAEETLTNHIGDAQDSMDGFLNKLVDTLLDRGLNRPTNPAKVDETVLAKPGNLAVASPTNLKPSFPGRQVFTPSARATHPGPKHFTSLQSSASYRPDLYPEHFRSPLASKKLQRRGGPIKAATAEKTATVTHPAYDILRDESIEEYNVQAILYKHKKSGAEVMSIIANDDNKVFGINFKTPPEDSTGLPHILEHSVLCGSQKYPVKEPFVDLLKGSLQNFLNAFTYPDRTCYPVATTNTKDFYNLQKVYIDAVLRPRAINDPQVLEQEGWHYELEKPEEPLTYKGVVYNEMKGVYSDPDSLAGRASQQALFPDNTYGVDSGGDPIEIPKLTFDDFKNFHGKFYHPSNSRIFYYGDDDPHERLAFLDTELQEFDKKDVNAEIAWQPRNRKPERKEVPYPIGKDAEPKHGLTVNWLLNDEHMSHKDLLAMGVLNSLLLGTSSAKLMKILTESQLGESVTGGGFDDTLQQSTFAVGLKGVKEENVQKVEELVLSSLEKIAEEGFEDDAIAAAMNTYEFRLREFNTGGFPKGLSLMLGMLGSWIYGRDPIESVRFEEILGSLKKDLADGKPVFQDLMKKYVTTNDHRVTIELKPDSNLESEMIKDEESRLEAVKSTLTKEQIDDIIESTKVLKEAQAREDSPEAKATLPRLTKDDISPKARELPIEVVKDGKDGGETILTHTLPTSGILYADIAFDFSNLDPGDLELLPLFCRMMMETGTSTMDDVTLQRKIGIDTGGISSTLLTDLKHSSSVSSGEVKDTLMYFLLRGKAVTDKVPAMFNLMKEVLTDSNLNNQQRAIEFLRESKIRKEQGVITAGHAAAATRLAARYSFLGYLGEVTNGITALRNAGPLLEMAEKDWPTLHKRMTNMRDKIVKKNGMIVNLSGDEKVLPAVMPAVDTFVGGMKKEETVPKTMEEAFSTSMLLPMENEGFSVPSQVNYVVKGGQLYKPGEKVSGSTSVVTRYLSLNYLWDNVRVMGGAYGGFARFGAGSGRMSMMSYRDPNLQKTLNIYDKAPEALLNHEVSQQDVFQGIIGAVSDLDSPLSPDQKGYESMVEYLTGEGNEDRQQWRDAVLSCSAKDFVDYGERLKQVAADGSECIVGSEAAFTEANADRPDGDKLKVSSAIS